MTAAEKPFIVPRRRVGTILRLDPEGRYGFIDAEDFREDVFFHRSAWQPERSGEVPRLEMAVEFELDEEHRRETGKLRARWARPTQAPVARQLEPRDAPHLQAKHHPNARRQKPKWRRGN